jgi:hypothetical protein
LAEIDEKADNNPQGLDREKRVIAILEKLRAANAAAEKTEERDAAKGR